MHNVDTVTLSMNCRQYISKTGKCKIVDWKNTSRINKKIKSKLYLKSANKNIRKNSISSNNNVKKYWYGKYQNYTFVYNEMWNYLMITVPHCLVEQYTQYQIINNVQNIIMKYFNLKQQEINKIQLNRIDIHNDFKFQSDEELNIIKNILNKAPDNFYTYKKQLLKDDDEGYILVYKAIRKNNSTDTLLSVERGIIEDKWGELENENYE